MLTIGVLSLQGGFSKHRDLLLGLGCDARLVKTSQELQKCHGLILPGGESTTMLYHIQELQMRQALQEFAKTHPIFGTCAGAILLASEVVGSNMTPFSLIDMQVERNAYGRQVESFRAKLSMGKTEFNGVFIRAPKIKSVGEGVEVLARYEEEAVLVRQKHFLAATFHPELSGDAALHQLFLEMVKGKAL